VSQVLRDISSLGTSIWLDDLSRERLVPSGSARSLTEVIEKESVVGVTTNPAIFSAAISQSPLYVEDIKSLFHSGADIDSIIAALTSADVTAACDSFFSCFERSGGIDGRVSIEVDPRFARDTTSTVEQARALWQSIDRPNLLIKVPATREGLPAIRTLISEGISVNVTIIFSVSRYREVLNAYLSGLEDRLAKGLTVSGIHSVASFFVSRVDTEIDARLQKSGGAPTLQGKAALANARLAYQHFLSVTESPRWKELSRHGALPQRPLWASTGVKDSRYDPCMYVTELVAPLTVNTMPEATLIAVRDSGKNIRESITDHFEKSDQIINELAENGIDIEEVAETLEREGIDKFIKPWLGLIETVSKVARA
jgi:transaldolase